MNFGMGRYMKKKILFDPLKPENSLAEQHKVLEELRRKFSPAHCAEVRRDLPESHTGNVLKDIFQQNAAEIEALRKSLKGNEAQNVNRPNNLILITAVALIGVSAYWLKILNGTPNQPEIAASNVTAAPCKDENNIQIAAGKNTTTLASISPRASVLIQGTLLVRNGVGDGASVQADHIHVCQNVGDGASLIVKSITIGGNLGRGASVNSTGPVTISGKALMGSSILGGSVDVKGGLESGASVRSRGGLSLN
jgi:hypothetical protein